MLLGKTECFAAVSKVFQFIKHFIAPNIFSSISHFSTQKKPYTHEYLNFKASIKFTSTSLVPSNLVSKVQKPFSTFPKS